MILQFTPRLSRHTPKFPNAIRRYRVQMGFSQQHLGAVLGLQRSIVSLWERGLRLPSLPRLSRMARELGTMPESLYHDFYSAFPQEGASTNAVAA